MAEKLFFLLPWPYPIWPVTCVLDGKSGGLSDKQVVFNSSQQLNGFDAKSNTSYHKLRRNYWKVAVKQKEKRIENCKLRRCIPWWNNLRVFYRFVSSKFGKNFRVRKLGDLTPNAIRNFMHSCCCRLTLTNQVNLFLELTSIDFKPMDHFLKSLILADKWFGWRMPVLASFWIKITDLHIPR